MSNTATTPAPQSPTDTATPKPSAPADTSGATQGASSQLQGKTTAATSQTTTGDSKPTSTTETTASGSTKPQEEQQQQDTKYASAITPQYSTNSYFNVLYSLLDDGVSAESSVQSQVTMRNGKTYKIFGYIVPKFNLNNDVRFSGDTSKSLALRLTYPNQLETIVLEDRLDNIGLCGFVELKSNDSYLDMFLERHNNFFFVLNFTEVSGQQQERYQPYIFDISWIEQLSNPQSNERKMRIHLVDCMTAILKSHSIASVIRFNNNIVQAASYKDVFGIILNYIKCYLKINSNVTCDFKKDLLYKSDVLCGGVKFNGNDADVNMSHLVKNTFGKISRNASIYEAMDQLLKDCITALKVPKSFSDGFQSIGDVLIPFFFKEQYPDRYKIYPSFWIDGDVFGLSSRKNNEPAKPDAQSGDAKPDAASSSDASSSGDDERGQNGDAQPAAPAPKPPAPPAQANIMPIDQQPANPQQPAQAVQPVNGTALGAMGNTARATAAGTAVDTDANIINQVGQSIKNSFSIAKHFANMFEVSANDIPIKMRQITMRDFFMPFYLCFGTDKGQNTPYAVYDVINPTPQDVSDKNLLAMNSYYSKESVKDIQFDPIDIDTIKKIWKNVVFIDCSSSGNAGNSTLIFFNWFYEYFSQVFLNRNKRGYVSNVIPDFYTIAKNANIGHADKQGKSFDSVFDEYNAYTYATETDDTVNECLRHMGRNIASFVLLNDMYTFTIDGDIMRRPNEIIKFGLRGDNNGAKSMKPIRTAFNNSDYLFLYVRKVTHKFSGNTYENIMNCCKICEQISVPQ